jgi:hypothetical protein
LCDLGIAGDTELRPPAGRDPEEPRLVVVSVAHEVDEAVGAEWRPVARDLDVHDALARVEAHRTASGRGLTEFRSVWAEQERLLEKAGQRMPVEDSYIAATARRHGLTRRVFAILALSLSVAVVSAGPSRYGLDRIERHLFPEITTGPDNPSWSPDGAWIAFSMQGDIWKVRRRAGASR